MKKKEKFTIKNFNFFFHFLKKLEDFKTNGSSYTLNIILIYNKKILTIKLLLIMNRPKQLS